MLTNQNFNTVIRSGPLDESTFRIKASGHAFQILSSRLYENPIKAIVRELSCNAMDAHIAAGTQDVPFVIKFPTRLDPCFYVRDYGTGISPEDIYSVYTTYFESTKTNSNDFTGCLGLGSKTPFAYTSTFIVVSYYNGTKYSYSAFLSETGLPSISLMGKEATDEPNGLMVQFAVAAEDRRKFVIAGREVIPYFAQAPKLLADEIVLETTKAPALVGSNWEVFGRDENKYGTEILAVMGNIAYPLNLNDDDIDLGTQDDPHLKLRQIRCLPKLVLKFQIGELNVAASREALHLDKSAKALISSRLAQFSAEFWPTLEASLEQETNVWKQKHSFCEALREMRLLATGDSLFPVVDDLKFYTLRLSDRRVSGGNRAVIHDPGNSFRFNGDATTPIYIVDKKSHITALKKEQRGNLVRVGTRQSVLGFIVLREHAEDFLSKIGDPTDDIVFEFKPTKLTLGASRQNNNMRGLRGVSVATPGSCSWERVTDKDELPESGVYVMDNGYYDIGFIRNFNSTLDRIGASHLQVDIYKFSDRVVAKMGEDPNWITLTDYAAQCLMSDWLKDKVTTAQDVVRSTPTEGSSYQEHYYQDLIEEINELDPTTNLSKVFQGRESIKENANAAFYFLDAALSLTRFARCQELWSIHLARPVPIKHVDNQIEDLMSKKYPMIYAMINSGGRRTSDRDLTALILNYVKEQESK